MRMGPDVVRLMAREFVGSSRAKLWHFVTSDVRNALIDAEIMSMVRRAHMEKDWSPFTPPVLLQLREDFVAALAAGVPRGPAGRIHFLIEE